MEWPYVFCVCGDGVNLLILRSPSAPLPLACDVILHTPAVLILMTGFHFLH